MRERQTTLKFYREQVTLLIAQLQNAWDIIAAVLDLRIDIMRTVVMAGDVLVIRGVTDPRASDAIVRRLQTANPKVTILTLPDGATLDVIDPELLEEQGWQRKT